MREGVIQYGILKAALVGGGREGKERRLTSGELVQRWPAHRRSLAHSRALSQLAVTRFGRRPSRRRKWQKCRLPDPGAALEKRSLRGNAVRFDPYPVAFITAAFAVTALTVCALDRANVMGEAGSNNSRPVLAHLISSPSATARSRLAAGDRLFVLPIYARPRPDP